MGLDCVIMYINPETGKYDNSLPENIAQEILFA